MGVLDESNRSDEGDLHDNLHIGEKRPTSRERSH